MATLILDQKSTVGDTGAIPNPIAIDRMSLQGFVVGTGAVSATVVVEGSNNGLDWVTISTLTMSGDTRASDGGVLQTLFERIRARITAVSGTNAKVSVSWVGRLV